MLATLNRGAGGSASAADPAAGTRIMDIDQSTQEKRDFGMGQTNDCWPPIASALR
jgi:hypothetical protein